MDVSGQFHAPMALPPGERAHGYLLDRNLLGPRTGLGAVAEKKIPFFVPTGNWTPVVQPLA
jgi:hypothetical protein